ncbi:hypothetical protein L6472_03625 [Prevotella sp. E13-17]|uniref:hypothetical protein n=1 Tax=Prevotella sp. E13-17 TaxID=2913616 RepID=UPI001EDBA326|nr:hypothetical protein [Prevotella sp. E13-17]UKK51688.1 hypothetical protein L6472_03625 [Prevotella sp. E13-17]
MSKVFRLYKEGTTTYQGWNESPAFPYNSNARDTIEDPDGASAKNEITSIPSPFARIDLVKTAFREVCRRATKDIKELDGNTIYHKMVSDSLDVGEIFFNIDKFKEKIEIITWDPSSMIPVLKNDNNVSHFYVADALDKYLQSDAKTYNFGQLQNIYLLNYTKGPDELNIIGATSPATLFFSGANNLEYIQDIFFANNDRPFDGDYVALYNRDFDYIKAWWTLRKTIPSFSNLFPEIESYLNLTFKAISDQQIKNKLNAITSASAKDFDFIDVQTHQQSNQVEVLGTVLFKKKGKAEIENEFTIRPERNIVGVKPLVLPVESGNKYSNLQYANGVWGNTNKAPYKPIIADIERRTLPYDGSVYSYLTISDFLEDTIVKVPHSLNKKYFFNGNLNEEEEMTSFLLPIKPLYFRYFSIETLNSTMPDGKLAFEMESVAGGSVNVIIRIPITGNGNINYIEYQRIYYAQRQADVSETQNSGGMTTFDFTGLVMPSMKFQNEEDAIYTVSCVSTFSNQFRFDFYRESEIIRDIPVDCRNQERGLFDFKAETYTIQNNNFDFIRVSNKGGISNVIIPNFLTHQNLEDFEFAIDLGTSNTHIEFKKTDNNGSESFNYKESEALFGLFFVQSYREIQGKLIPLDLIDENDLIVRDFIPVAVGDESDFSFPTRTALSYAKSTDWTEKLRTFGLINFDITYNKKLGIAYNAKPMVNIKWSSKPNAQSAMQAYIRNIMMIIRNKVIANNGNLARTKITWFYPNSMSPRRLSQLKNAWNDSYSELFNRDGATRNISESVAPIQFYFRRYATATNLVNVDIGGGTTDIAFSSNGKVEYITSFKFAANSLFEDSFSDINPNNGIVDWFKNDILGLLQSKPELNELVNIFNSNLGQPANMASFLFSLKDNSATKSLAQNNIDFNKILQNDTKFKLVFIIFYTAIVYHIAQIVKTKGLKAPRHIAFSGNGSKIVGIISSDPKILGKYTKVIFEKVLGTEYESALDILGLEQGSNPKESTCKGGLIATEAYEEEPETLILRDSSGKLANVNDTYASISDTHKAEIVKTVKDFFRFALTDIPSAFNLDNNFGVDNVTMKIAKEECTKDLETYLDKGIELSIKESGNKDNPIEDAISFYPIKGVLQSLSSKIHEYYLENPSK